MSIARSLDETQPFATQPFAPMPAALADRVLMHAVRRMAIGGLDDAMAHSALMAFFGIRYRRPLVLVRALMAEVARVSQRQILIAPGCCLRMTRDEQWMLATVQHGSASPHRAHAILAALTATDDCLGALSSAQAVEQAFADLGHPLGEDELA